MNAPLHRLAAAAASLMIAASPGFAGAQPARKGGPAAEPAKPSSADLAEARKHMEAGAAFYNDPNGHRCEEAYREFAKAYDLSKSLKALKALGICALELEHDDDAIERFEKYLAEKGAQIEASDKAQVESDIMALKAAVARVTLRADRKDVRVTDVRTQSKGPPVTNDYVISEPQTLGIHPGRHTFTASAEGMPSLTWTTDIANGGTYEHSFDFAKAGSQGDPKPRGPAERPVPTTVFVFGGLTVALAIPTVILMVRAGVKNSDYEAQNGNFPADALESTRSDVKTANLLADIFLGASVASLAATGIFYISRALRTRRREPPRGPLLQRPADQGAARS